MFKRRQIFICLIVLAFIIVASCQSTGLADGEIAEIPEMTVKIGEDSYTVYHGAYSIEKREGGSMTVETTDAASPNQIAETFTPFPVNLSDNVEIDLDGDPQIQVLEWDENGHIGEIEIDDQSFTLPDEPGEMIIEVVGTWKNAEASFTFVVDIGESD